MANLRETTEEKEEKNYNSLCKCVDVLLYSSDWMYLSFAHPCPNPALEAYRKSISLSDLSRSSNTLPRRLSVFRANNHNSTPAAGATGNQMNNCKHWTTERERERSDEEEP